MKRCPLLIFPFNGNAIEAVDCISDMYELKGFIDDDSAKQGSSVFQGLPVFSRKILCEMPEVMILAVPGSPTTYHMRDTVIMGLGVESERYATVIHPRAVVSRNARIGANVLIMAGVVVTSNAVIGDHVCVLPNSVIHHDSVVGDFTLVGSNVTIAGGCKIGRKCYIGSGSSIINGAETGANCLVGMGTNVIKSIAANSTVVGNPHRLIRSSGDSIHAK